MRISVAGNRPAQHNGESMATASEQLAELKQELADLAKQAERLAGRAREINDRLERPIIIRSICDQVCTSAGVGADIDRPFSECVFAR